MCDIGIERCEVEFELVARESRAETERVRPVPEPDPPVKAPETPSS